jgi:hydrogenase/urease accessory protein HupE
VTDITVGPGCNERLGAFFLDLNHQRSKRIFSAISFLVPGSLVAADLRLKPGAVAAIAVVLGFSDGYLSDMTIQPTGFGSFDLVGTVAALFVMVSIVAAFVIWLKRQWMRVAVRVVGSRITATGLLLLGWSIHSGSL